MQFRGARIMSFLLAGTLLGALVAHIVTRNAEPGMSTPASSAPLHAIASPWVVATASKVRLESAQSALGQGRVLLGLHMELEEGWKTYWRNPGDSGFSPRFDWSGSENLKSIELLWPIPAAFDEAGERYYGYKHDVLWPLKVTVNDPSKPLVLSLKLDYGVCSDVCVPASILSQLILAPGLAERTRASFAIEDAVERLPAKMQMTNMSATVRLEDVSGHRAQLAIELTGYEGELANSADLVIVTGQKGTYFGASKPDGEKGFRVPLEADAPEDLRGRQVDLLFLGRDEAEAMGGLFFIQ